MSRRIIAMLLTLAAVGAVMAGAPPARAADADSAIVAPASGASLARGDEYLLQTGDTIEFRFPYSAELNFTAPIRPDGRVFFAYIGDMQLAGLTVEQAHSALVSRYRGVLRDPEVFVLLHEYLRPGVFVAGEVPHPGRLDYFRGMSVMNAIFTAGGYSDNASRKTAVLLRHVSPDHVRLVSVDLRPTRNVVGDFMLEPDDIVLVPKSTIANLNKIVRQYSRDLLPIASVGLVFRAFGTAAVNVSTSP